MKDIFKLLIQIFKNNVIPENSLIRFIYISIEFLSLEGIVDSDLLVSLQDLRFSVIQMIAWIFENQKNHRVFLIEEICMSVATQLSNSNSIKKNRKSNILQIDSPVQNILPLNSTNVWKGCLSNEERKITTIQPIFYVENGLVVHSCSILLNLFVTGGCSDEIPKELLNSLCTQYSSLDLELFEKSNIELEQGILSQLDTICTSHMDMSISIVYL